MGLLTLDILSWKEGKVMRGMGWSPEYLVPPSQPPVCNAALIAHGLRSQEGLEYVGGEGLEEGTSFTHPRESSLLGADGPVRCFKAYTPACNPSPAAL